MFIRWRKYQRQLNGKKGDKFILQPIIVESYRPGRKRLEIAKGMLPSNIPVSFLNSPEVRKKAQMPRHQVVYKLPSYPACMVVYFRNPRWMQERFLWWEAVNKILAKLAEMRDDMPPSVVDKLKAALEEAVPIVTPEEEEKLKVVFNDLPLHLTESTEAHGYH